MITNVDGCKRKKELKTVLIAITSKTNNNSCNSNACCSSNKQQQERQHTTYPLSLHYYLTTDLPVFQSSSLPRVQILQFNNSTYSQHGKKVSFRSLHSPHRNSFSCTHPPSTVIGFLHPSKSPSHHHNQQW
jgi:hypothetical protein